MRILAPVFESYPAQHPASFILMHQSMALEDMGHEVHLFNITRPLYRLADFWKLMNSIWFIWTSRF